MLAAAHVYLPTQAAAAAVAFKEIPTSIIGGVIETRDNGCVLLVTPHGRRYEVRGSTSLSEGAQVSLAGVIIPVRNPVCRAPLAITVSPGSAASTSSAAASPSQGPTSPGLRAPFLSPEIHQGGS
jgi:hypothetical protein